MRRNQNNQKATVNYSSYAPYIPYTKHTTNRGSNEPDHAVCGTNNDFIGWKRYADKKTTTQMDSVSSQVYSNFVWIFMLEKLRYNIKNLPGTQASAERGFYNCTEHNHRCNVVKHRNILFAYYFLLLYHNI